MSGRGWTKRRRVITTTWGRILSVLNEVHIFSPSPGKQFNCCPLIKKKGEKGDRRELETS